VPANRCIAAIEMLPDGWRCAKTEPSRLTWSYADDRANDGQPRDPDVDRAVARLFAARARQEAVQRNRSGDYDGARHPDATEGIAAMPGFVGPARADR
jgi:hypothetical protein